MADDPALLARLHEAITGKPTVDGDYSDAVAARVLTALDAAFELAEKRGVLDQVKVVAGTQPGPWSTPAAPLDDVRQQVTSRFRFDDASKWRTLPEAARQLANILAVLPDETAPSAPPPAPSGSLPPGTKQGTLTWAADPTKADSTAMGFQKSLIQRQWNNGSIQTSSTPVPAGAAPDGSRGLVYHLPAGMERLEVQPPVAQNITSGQEVWIGFWFVGDVNVERARDPWSIILQCHGDDTVSPHQIIAVDGGSLITGNGGTLKRFCSGRIKANVRYNVVTKISATSGGPQSVWVNGELVLDNYKAGLNKPPGYIKSGLYRQPNGSPDQTIWVGGHRIGSGYGAVRPLR